MENNGLQFMIFDTETTGLPINNNYSHLNIIEIGWVITDKYMNVIKEQSYIINGKFDIPNFIKQLTGISKQLTINEGMSIFDVLKEFYNVFWIVLAMQPFCALAFIFDGVFKGLGRMKYLRNVLLFSTFIIFIPVLLWLDYLDYKLYAIFIGITFWIIARGIPLIIKFRKIFIPLSQKA